MLFFRDCSQMQVYLTCNLQDFFWVVNHFKKILCFHRCKFFLNYSVHLNVMRMQWKDVLISRLVQPNWYINHLCCILQLSMLLMYISIKYKLLTSKAPGFSLINIWTEFFAYFLPLWLVDFSFLVLWICEAITHHFAQEPFLREIGL